MKALPPFLAFAAALAAACCVFARADDGAKDYKLALLHAEDAVEVRVEKSRTLFDVTCPRGIGEVKVERQAEAWPAAVAVRLRLKGLEGFNASNGSVTLHAFVPSSGAEKPPAAHASSRDAKGKETALDKMSPLWPTVAAADGHFEVTLPKAFFEGNPKSITLSWVDFYRR